MTKYPLLRGARCVWAVPCVWLVLLSFCAAGAQAQRRVALPAESVVKDVELFPWESILPSPDGQLVAYQTSDPSKHMQFDYPSQTITKPASTLPPTYSPAIPNCPSCNSRMVSYSKVENVV